MPRGRFSTALVVLALACDGPGASMDAGTDAGRDARVEDVGVDAPADGGDVGPPVCSSPTEGEREPIEDRTLEVFRADIAADCEGNIGLAWVEGRVPTTATERDVDIFFRLLPADGAPGAALRLTDDAGNAGNVRIASTGSRWLLAWSDAVNDPDPTTCFGDCDFEARFAIVGADGAIERGPEVLADGEGRHLMAGVAADRHGSALFAYIVSTDTDEDGTNDHFEAFARPMAADGTLADPVSISRGASVRNGLRLARAPGAYWISYTSDARLVTVRWPDGAASPDAPVVREDAALVTRVAAADDGRVAVFVHHGSTLEEREMSVIVYDAAGTELGRTAIELGHGGDGSGLTWIGERLFATDRMSFQTDLVELDPSGGAPRGRSIVRESSFNGFLNGIDLITAGDTVVFEGNSSQEHVVVVHRPAAE